MRKGLKRVIITAAGIVIFTTNFATTTFADEIDSELTTFKEETLNNVRTRTEKLNSNKLIVVEREVYRDILSGDTAIIERKDNLLRIDSENITDEELEIIESSNSFYLFGTFDGDISNLEDLENYEGGLYGDTKYRSAVDYSNKNVDRDIILVNGESIVDYFIAMQLGDIEDKNVLLVGDELTPDTQEYLENNGTDKNITFLEGDKSISEETKREVMEITGAEKYELGKTQLIKKVNQRAEDAKESPGNMTAETVSRLKEKTFGEESRDTTNRIVQASRRITDRTKENNDTLLYNKGKVVAYEDLDDDENSENNNFDNFIAAANKELESTKLLTDEDVKDEVAEGYSLQITKANPIDIHSSVEEGKEEFIVPKETTDEIVQTVINGDYGNTEERKRKLTAEGYNADEIQMEIEEIVAEQREQERIEQERIEQEREAERQEQQRQAEIARQAEAERQAQERQAAEQRQAQQAASTSSQSSPSSSSAPSTSSSSSNSNSSVSTSTSSSTTSAPSAPSAPAPSAPASTPAPSTSASIESFINEALKMEGWTYSQSQRMQYGFADCSSIISKAMVNAGMTSNPNLNTRSIVSDSRFYQVPMSQIKRGDILWTNGHMEIYMGGDTTFGAFRPGRPAGYASNISRFVRAYRISGY